MKRVFSLGVGALALVGLSLFATPSAHADTFGGVTCTGFITGSHTYPADGTNALTAPGHYLVCISNPTSAQITNENSAEGAIQGFFSNGSTGSRDKLKSAGVTFYYFATRDDYNSYVGAKYSSSFQTSTARCGNTFGNSHAIVSAVFDQCTYSTGTKVTNSNPGEASKHEGGHAWDVALGVLNSTNGPSRSAGFQNLVQQSYGNQDTIWSHDTLTQGNAYDCSLFGTVSPSALELDFGASSGPVCTGNTNNYPGHDPSDILNLKLPYFFTNVGSPLYAEWWAQNTVLVSGGAGGTDLLPLTDTYFNNSGTTCSRYGMDYYWTHGVAPPQNSYPTGCNGVDPNTFK